MSLTVQKVNELSTTKPDGTGMWRAVWIKMLARCCVMGSRSWQRNLDSYVTKECMKCHASGIRCWFASLWPGLLLLFGEKLSTVGALLGPNTWALNAHGRWLQPESSRFKVTEDALSPSTGFLSSSFMSTLEHKDAGRCCTFDLPLS